MCSVCLLRTSSVQNSSENVLNSGAAVDLIKAGGLVEMCDKLSNIIVYCMVFLYVCAIW